MYNIYQTDEKLMREKSPFSTDTGKKEIKITSKKLLTEQFVHRSFFVFGE
ncbi:hypothetical protein RV03_GL003098 [Enterococcus gallinarum]|nr:hypothetical protein RV03_GL003098 [Enterococcus gallinarum]